MKSYSSGRSGITDETGIGLSDADVAEFHRWLTIAGGGEEVVLADIQVVTDRVIDTYYGPIGAVKVRSQVEYDLRSGKDPYRVLLDVK